MNPETTELGSHVVNIRSLHEEEHKTNGAISTRAGITSPVSEPGSTDPDLNTKITNGRSSVLPQRRQEKRACLGLIKGTREEYLEICVPLYEAAITSDWEAARVILEKRPELVRYAVTHGGETMLHIAISGGEDIKMVENFVKNLVDMMEVEDLELMNGGGDFALTTVAALGSLDMFKRMLNKHKDLLNLSPEITLGALSASTVNGNHEMALHLYNVLETPSYEWFWTDTQRCFFITGCVDSDMFDIAFQVLEDHPNIATSMKFCKYVLVALAQRPNALNTTEPNVISRIANPFFAFFHMKNRFPKKDNHALKLLRTILKCYPQINKSDIIDNGVPDFEEMHMILHNIVHIAAERGNSIFVIETIKIYPQSMLARNNDGHSIFHMAVMHRHEGIYNLLYEIGSKRAVLVGITDNEENSMLHLVGKTSSRHMQLGTVSGASLLMQRELLWFKEVERMIPPYMRNLKNTAGKTAYELFSDNNQELVSKGLKWTKDCMVVTTLIITIAFAAAFTVPGGYDQETGIPIFHPETSFLVFMIADGVSLFSSSTSLLVFLSILTSPHGQHDFLYSLPKKLMIGLVTLFISVAAMMVTFAASFFVLYRNTHTWLPILISILAATPVIIFAALQYPLLMDMFRSMYDSRYLFNPRRQVLYKKKKD